MRNTGSTTCSFTFRLTALAKAIATGFVTGSLMLTTPAMAEIYRVVDDAGNVSYTDTPPPKNQAIVDEVPVDERPNIIDSSEEVAERNPEWVKEAERKRKDAEREARTESGDKALQKSRMELWKDELKAAKEAVKMAERDLEEGSEAGEGDFIGKVGGGARPSSAYIQRVEFLEQALIEAKKNLKAVKARKPKTYR